MSENVWWRGDSKLGIGYLLGVEDGALFRDTIRGIPDSMWPEVYATMAQYLSTTFNGRIPKRQEKRDYVTKESQRRKQAMAR